jgi:large subunit ribosomal protein L9
MKVILLTDVPKVGKRYDVKDFKDGYAINVLISKGLAELATPQALLKLESKKNEMSKKRQDEEKSFAQLISSIDNKKIVIKVKANEKGHLFKSIGPKDIALAIKKETGLVFDEDVIIAHHIKELGSHKVKIKKGDQRGECEVILEAQ